MNLISRIELTDLTDAELGALFGRISRELSEAIPESLEWRAALISLDNIRHEQARRRAAVKPRPKPGGPGF